MPLLIRAACLTNYREVASTSGLDPVRMLLDTGLSPSVLDEPDLMIPTEAVARLLQSSATASGNENFGLCMARSRQLSNLGPVGLLMRFQPTLRDSLQTLLRYQVTLSGTLLITMEESGGVVIIREAVVADDAHKHTRQRVELALGVMISLIRQVLGKDHWQPQRVCFEHGPPLDRRLHNQLFGQFIEFDCAYNCVVCDRKILDDSNPFADAAMARYAQKLIDDTVKLPESDTLNNVRRAILLLLPSGRCSIEKVSEHLGVRPRTVQRHLSEHHQSFSSLVNEVRRDLATRYVLESDRSLTDISEILGFNVLSSFSRWYLTQFGSSAKKNRAQRQSTLGATKF